MTGRGETAPNPARRRVSGVLPRLALVGIGLTASAELRAAESARPGGHGVPAAAVVESGAERLWRVVTLHDPNTRVVMLGTGVLGAMGGVVGVFMLLRRRALMGDVVGHAALPGIAGGFLVAEFLAPGSGRSLPLLLTGAFAAGLLGALCVMFIDRFSRIQSDAALAIVLSAFYGLGVVLLSVVQRVPTGASAGLGTYLNGKTASLLSGDVWLFCGAALVVLLVTLLLFKEFTLLCFDDVFAAANGWPTFLLDWLLITLVAAVTIIGMQSVGLILVVATLITPSAAARFWTDNLRRLTVISAALGALSAVLGIALSTAIPRVAAGATIVLIAGALFALSAACGARRGILWRQLHLRKMRRVTARHDLLRGIYEQIEQRSTQGGRPAAVGVDSAIGDAALRAASGGTERRRRRSLRWARSAGLLSTNAAGLHHFTPAGLAEARRLVRNHRLWEMYLIRYAEIAASHVDHTADLIEHVLDEEIVEELERLLAASRAVPDVPASPHAIPATVSEEPAA